MIRLRHLFALAVFALATMVYAVPAHRDTLHVAQPDGTTLSIRLLGDEFGAWYTTLDGYAVKRTTDGAWVYAELVNGKLSATTVLAHNAAQRTASDAEQLSKMKPYQRPAASAAKQAMRRDRATWQPLMSRRLQMAATAEGMPQASYTKFRGLVVLVEFADKQFLRPDYAELMNDMLNKPNYEGYYTLDETPKKVTFTGSVRDYFYDSSCGIFSPEFDVYGPVRIDKSMYDTDGSNDMQEVLTSVINAMDTMDVKVDFSKYDTDGDKVVDLIYFVFAGAGSHITGNDERLVWPHAWSFYPPIRRNGVRLYEYACSTELYGREHSTTLDGIGTICHEFSHVLGLVDEYDTDYEENGEVLDTPGDWSLMDGGSYLNYALTPPSYSTLQRVMAGFSTPTLITTPGAYALADLDATGIGYQINTPHKKEYFLLENRRKTKWNAYLPNHGMLVYQVDKSNLSPWNNNEVNAYEDKPCYILLRADESEGFTSFGAGNPFPGTSNATRLTNYTTPSLLTFHGSRCELEIVNIREANDSIFFDVVEALKPQSISLNATALDLKVDESITLQASITPAELSQSEVKWKTSAPTVAAVDKDGKVQALAPGTATITATAFNGLQAQCTVTVSLADGVHSVIASGDADDSVYDLAGRRVGSVRQLSTLPHGVYVVRGVKVVR